MKHADVGQMNTYLNYYKTEINEETDNAPIGMILCTSKDKIEAEYALGGLSNQIFASTYVLYLPDKEMLLKEVEDLLRRTGLRSPSSGSCRSGRCSPSAVEAGCLPACGCRRRSSRSVPPLG